MRYHLKRHNDSQFYYWKENEHDKLVNFEFISFQGEISGVEVSAEGRPYALLGIGSIIFYRQSGVGRALEVKTKEIHQVEILGDAEVSFGPNMVLNILNPNPIDVKEIFEQAELVARAAKEYQESFKTPK